LQRGRWRGGHALIVKFVVGLPLPAGHVGVLEGVWKMGVSLWLYMYMTAAARRYVDACGMAVGGELWC
jgi:hypothetical protein